MSSSSIIILRTRDGSTQRVSVACRDGRKLPPSWRMPLLAHKSAVRFAVTPDATERLAADRAFTWRGEYDDFFPIYEEEL